MQVRIRLSRLFWKAILGLLGTAKGHFCWFGPRKPVDKGKSLESHGENAPLPRVFLTANLAEGRLKVRHNPVFVSTSVCEKKGPPALVPGPSRYLFPAKWKVLFGQHCCLSKAQANR